MGWVGMGWELWLCLSPSKAGTEWARGGKSLYKDTFARPREVLSACGLCSPLCSVCAVRPGRC